MSPTREPLCAGGIQAWFFQLEAPTARRLAHHERLLDTDELERADRFHFAPDRERFIVRRGTLRELLAAQVGTEPERLVYARNEQGKPRLAGPAGGDELHFNTSHSGQLGMVALARGQELGCDVEDLTRELDELSVGATVLSELELEHLRNLQGDARRAAFFRAWTRKEAVVKAQGRGLMRPLTEFDAALADPAERLALADPDRAQPWDVHTFRPKHGYVASVVVGEPDRLAWGFVED